MTAIESDPIAFVDLIALHREVRLELDAAWEETVASGCFVGGPVVDRFEAEWANACRRRHAVGVGNGTDALELILRSLGIGRGDEVLLPTNTFVATAEAITAAGAIPRFIDVDPCSLSVTAPLVEAAIGRRTAAIVAVHLFGRVVPQIDHLVSVARRHGLALIEDAAQAHLATHDGRPAGSFGVAAAFSFYPGKNLGALGDGGAVVTDDDALAAQVRVLANHGRSCSDRNLHDQVGRNSRLDALQAAVLAVKLPRLAEWNARRRRSARFYEQHLAGSSITPLDRDGPGDAFHLFVVRCPDRAAAVTGLARASVPCGIHYPVPCHHQPAFSSNHHGALPVAEKAADEILSLPMHPSLRDSDVVRVAAALGCRPLDDDA